MMTQGLKNSDEPSRAALAAAIADAETARRNLEIARVAAGNAENQVYEARGKLEAMREREPANGASPDRILEVLAAAGSEFDVNALEMPGEDARREEAKVENEIAAWGRARDVAEQAIPDRQLAVERAERKVEIAARRVICADIDVGRLVAEAEEAATSIVEKRIILLHLMRLLPDGDDRKAIEKFMARPWLSHEFSGAWQNHPVIAPYRAIYAALMRDASAPVPA
jgi:predicted  nucleic acid-binding Zn-ribbon protein